MIVATPAGAATTFFTTFEDVPGGPTEADPLACVMQAQGWTAGPNRIELQRGSTGPADPPGGAVYAELDVVENS